MNQTASWRGKNVEYIPCLILILAHPVYKMWIIQETNMSELWNKLHFEEEKHVEYIPCLILILAHPVYKMWIIHEPNMLELWNKLNFEEEKT